MMITPTRNDYAPDETNTSQPAGKRYCLTGTVKGGCMIPRGAKQLTAILFYFLSFISIYGSPRYPSQEVKKDVAERITPAQRQIDSLKTVLKMTTSGRDSAEIFAELCVAYVGTLGEVVVARAYADSLKLLADKLNDPSLQASSNYYYGLVERYEGKYSQALDHFKCQMDYCTISGDSSRLPSTLYQIAVAHALLGNYEESLSISYEALHLFEKNRSGHGIAITFINIGGLFIRLKNPEKAIAMYHQALLNFDSLDAILKVKMNKLRVLINLGNAYITLKEYDKARRFFNQSLVISRSLGSKLTTGTSLSNIGSVLFALGKYDSALVYHLKALAIRKQASQEDKVMVSLLDVGETYIFLRNFSLANQYLLKALSMANAFQSKPNIRNAYANLTLLYSVQGDSQKAYEYHQLFVAMKDSVLNQEVSQQLGELQTKYETEEKDKQITLLAKEKEIQKKEFERKSTVNKAFVGGLVAVTLLTILVFHIFRQRLRLVAKNEDVKEADFRRKVSELKMKALRAQINPHFLFNCMNAINLMILKGLTEKASRYLAKFSKLVRLILENAEASAVTLESEMSLVESYIQLEELRLPGKICYSISVDESISVNNTYLPSMLLQPVVENAIWHGIVHKENEQGNISIGITQHNDELLCTVEDNGVGRKRAQQLREKSSVKNELLGMKITEERLRLRTRKPMEQCIEVTDLKDEFDHALGTRVTIHIPIAEQND